MKPVRVLQLAFVLVSAVLVYSFVASAQDGELRKSCVNLCALSPNYVGQNRLAPDIQLKELNGTPVRLFDYRGKTVVLAFWSSTCSACKKQMPALIELADTLRNDNRFALLTVAVDDNADTVRKTLRASTHKADPFPVLLDPESEFVLGKYGTRLFPETWVVDADGVIRARFDGPRDWSSASVVDLLESLAGGDSCPLDLQGGMAAGRGAALCRGSSAAD